MDAPWTAVHNTPNKSIRQNVTRLGVVLHHAAMTSLSGLRDMEVNGTKQVSSTAICKDDNLELVVSDDRYRPWSLSSAYWDSAMRSVETCNESTTGWTISDASHWSLAKAVAYWATTDDFWPHRDGDPSTWTVIGHREVYSIHDASYSTACPGGLDLNLVTARAQGLLNGTMTAGGSLTPVKEYNMGKAIYHPARGGAIIRDGAPPESYPSMVFDVLKKGLPYVEHTQDYEWDTEINQAWNSFNTVRSEIAKLLTGTAPAAAPIDYAKLAAEIVDRLPESADTDAIAQAVLNGLAVRVAS